MSARTFHDGRDDGLVPLESLSLTDVHSFADLLRSMAKTAFSGRQLGEALEIVLEMVRNESCRVVLTISGAMTVAKQGRIVCDAIDRGLIDAIVATGALIAHGLTESIGCVHYRHDPSHSDETLYARGYNRIYDTLEMEANLTDAGSLIVSILDTCHPENDVWSSASFCRELGKRLSEQPQFCGILRSAYEKNVPVFIPAFTDSDIGLVVAAWASQQWHKRQEINPSTSTLEQVFHPVPQFNPFLDLQQYTRLVAGAEYIGILTLGGGVPRNWAQQVAPYVENTNARLGTAFRPPRFRYGVRLCPEPVHWGGLSGCTYSEGVSWGKFMSASDGGRFAEVYADATLVFPLLMKAVFEQLECGREG